MIIELSRVYGHPCKIKCDYCGKSFSRIFSELKNIEHHFCNMSCRSKYHVEFYIHSEKTKIKIGLGNKGKHHSEETKQKIGEAAKGRICSEETRKKLSELSMGSKNSFYGKKHPEEILLKIGMAHRSENLSEETRLKMIESHLGNHQTEETKLKIGLGHIGAKNVNWKGGVTPENHRVRMSYEYNKWRTAVYERDDYTCQSCLIRGVRLHAHHIKLFSEYPELRLELSNGITYCKDCHDTGGFHNKVLTA